MNVLSLFDGISGGQVALERAGIKVNNYFASEIDNHAISVTQCNYPKTQQLGSVTGIRGENLPRIDLLIGGSPCQGFSLAGKQLNFEDPRSKLFFEYVRVLRELRKSNPDILFLLENVHMKKECRDIISEQLGVQPIFINSRVLSAQNRPRIYWTNIPVETIVNDSPLVIGDILEKDVIGFELSEKRKKIIESGVFKQTGKIFTEKDKCCTLTAGMGMGGGVVPKIQVNNIIRYLTPLECERLQTLPDNYTSTISKTQRYKAIGNGWTINVISHIFKRLK